MDKDKSNENTRMATASEVKNFFGINAQQFIKEWRECSVEDKIFFKRAVHELTQQS